MITICIDEGNTSAKVALFAGDNMVKYTRFEEEWAADWKQFIGPATVDNVIVTSSKEDYNTLESNLDGFNYRIIKDVTDIPLEIAYDTPETLGKDRVLSAYAASMIYPGDHAVIFDMGTCMTSDVLEKGKTFIGGNISPGLEMRLQAMHENTSKLPWVEVNNENPLVGKSTQTALQNGAFYGMLFEIQGFIISLRKNYNQLRVMLTGGSAQYFAPQMGRSTYVDPFLNIKGLHFSSKYYD